MPGLKKITTFLHNFSFRRYRFNRIKKHHLLSWRVSFERNSLWKTLLSFCSLYGIIKIKDKIFQKKAIISKYYIGLWPSPIDFVVFFFGKPHNTHGSNVYHWFLHSVNFPTTYINNSPQINMQKTLPYHCNQNYNFFQEIAVTLIIPIVKYHTTYCKGPWSSSDSFQGIPWNINGFLKFFIRYMTLHQAFIWFQLIWSKSDGLPVVLYRFLVFFQWL